MEEIYYDEKIDVIDNGSPLKKKGKHNSFKIESTEVKNQLKIDYKSETNIKLKIKGTLGSSDIEVLAVRLSNDDKKVAGTYADGSLKIFIRDSGLFRFYIESFIASFETSTIKTPCTSLRFRPVNPNKYTEALTAVNSDGTITQFNVENGKVLFTTQEEGNQILCCDYSETGKYFATAGKDMKIRIYDEESKSVVHTLQRDALNKGHSNRIFATKFLPGEGNVLMSGGWDENIFFWDLRIGKTFESINGPLISGDSIDFKDDKILTGSYKTIQPLKIWDFKTFKLDHNIPWADPDEKEIALVYGAQFSKIDNKTILSGCSGANQVRLFNNGGEYLPLASISNIPKACYSVDFGNKSNSFVFAGGDGKIYIAQKI